MCNYCNGLSRKTKGFQKPKGKQRPDVTWANYPERIPDFSLRLRGVVIRRSPALHTIAATDGPSTFFYVDPPYVHESQRGVRETYRYEMSSSQHEELAETLGSISGMAAVSGYETELYNRIYRGWETIFMKHHTVNNKPVKEALWLSPNTVAALEREGKTVEALRKEMKWGTPS
jgi:DNA adenine methylase